MSDQTEVHPEAGTRAPPYVSFQTFLTLLEDLKTNGLPPQIDRSVLKRFSGGVGSQLLAALKSLSLIDDGNRPKPALDQLVEAVGTDDLKAALRPVVEAGYPFLAKLDLRTATPSMFADAFKNGTQARDDVLRKCRTFYLHAARHVDIELGPRLVSGSAAPRAPGGSGVGRRRIRSTRQKHAVDANTTNGTQHPPANTPQPATLASYQDKLLEKFPTFDPAWPADLKAAWFQGFQKLLAAAPDEKEGDSAK
ncbi:MAG TPA: hypothetical protein VGF29_12245 [Hyphomicrobiaceae bacterium]|jgi:hypothetical protein